MRESRVYQFRKVVMEHVETKRRGRVKISCKTILIARGGRVKLLDAMNVL